MGVIFDNIGYTGLLENTVQNGLGQTPGYANVGSGDDLYQRYTTKKGSQGICEPF
jgi:hypothetical protein